MQNQLRFTQEMTYHSDGSQPKLDPKKFLSSYIDVEDLTKERAAAPGDEALRGKVDDTVKGKYKSGVLKV